MHRLLLLFGLLAAPLYGARYWLYWYQEPPAVRFQPGPGTQMSFEDAYPGLAGLEIRLRHQTTGQTADLLSFDLSRGQAAALADIDASFVSDPFWWANPAGGPFSLRLSFRSDVPGSTEVHTVTHTYDSSVDGFYGVQIDSKDYPALRSLLSAYAEGAGSYLTVSLNNAGTNFRDLDLGLFNLRIESPAVTEALFINRHVSVGQTGPGQYAVVLDQSQGGVNYTLQASPDLVSWTNISSQTGTNAELTWTHASSAERIFFRVSDGAAYKGAARLYRHVSQVEPLRTSRATPTKASAPPPT
jgi:hypothetical protein